MKFGIPEGSAIDLPESSIDEEAKSVEQQMAAFTEKPEWQKLKDYLESRIAFYQTYLPNGTPMEDIPMEEVAARWSSANTVIKEMKAIISTYEGVAKSVQEEA